MKGFTSIDEYIASCPKELHTILKQIKEIIKQAAPKAEEGISYGMPAFNLNGPLIYFAVFKNHIGIYPTASPIVAFKKELKEYKTSKGTIQLPIDKPKPEKLITSLVKFKLKENANKLK